jgi:hypothetical protein
MKLLMPVARMQSFKFNLKLRLKFITVFERK